MPSLSVFLTGSSRNAKISLAFAAGLWGLYWIPLRALDEAGITGAWATVSYYLIPLAVAGPFMIFRWRRLMAGGWRLFWTSLVGGLALVFYSNSLIFTEVVHAVLLYYLTPIWSTLLGRIILKEVITPARIIAIFVGFAGMFVILGGERGLPIPRNIGDWMALASGILWAVTAVRLRQDKVNEAEELTFAYFLVGAAVALAATLIPDGRTGPMPSAEAVLSVLPWLVPVVIAVVMTSSFLVMWGTRMLDPGLVGILFMTEISVGTGTAAFLAGEPFGLREIAGIVLITSAGLVEIVWPAFVKTRGQG